MRTQAEWDALTDEEKRRYFVYLDTRRSLRDSRRRMFRNGVRKWDLDTWFGIVRAHEDKWVEQKWVAEVDLVMETRIDCEPERLAAA